MGSHNRLISIIQDARKYLYSILGVLIAGTIGFYTISPQLLRIIQNHLDQELVFYTVAEPFLAHVKIALSFNLFFLAPLFVTVFWRLLAKHFDFSFQNQLYFIIFTCLLFYGGSLFCYFITLPYGIDFLLGFESEQLKPVISIGKFVSFVTVFVLAFGLIFELPIFMVFFAKTGIIARQNFEKGRRYAVLAISIIAALLTPTPDVVNMLLMGGPLYMLYEFGIIILRLLKI